jgi:hypothetical protein
MVEMMAALVLVGMIASAAAFVLFHEFRGTATAKNITDSSLNIGFASHWIGRDVMMAEASNLVEGAPPANELTLTWVEWYQLAGIPHRSTYRLSGTALIRDYDGVITMAAQNLSGVAFSQTNQVITVVFTSKPPWTPTKEQKRTIRVMPRPKG